MSDLQEEKKDSEEEQGERGKAPDQGTFRHPRVELPLFNFPDLDVVGAGAVLVLFEGFDCEVLREVFVEDFGQLFLGGGREGGHLDDF